MNIGRATYSPEDNKLRLYPESRLDPELYDRVRKNGFIWAPKQGLFVAPMWTPQREDLLLELCGEIDDEDTSLVERAEERAERFGNYSENREADAERAKKAVDAIAQKIPFGQPILVGHHSEKRARKDAQKIENGMRHAVKMWETAEYWQRRAAGAIHHAKYKERPDVRSRRIKKLEAEKRKQEKYLKDAEKWLRLWTEDGLTLEKARSISNFCHLSVILRDDGYYWSSYDVLQPDGERYKDCPSWTVEQVQETARKAYPKAIARYNRWINHYTNRITYEKAMNQENGGTVADRTKPEKGGACKSWAARGQWAEIVKVNKVTVTIMDNWGNGGKDFPRNMPFDKLCAVMSRAEWEAVKNGTAQPEAEAPRTPRPEKKENSDLEAMKSTLKEGIKIISAPQLFPTPVEIAEKMVELANLEAGEKVLEPSAGTGNILKAIIDVQESTERIAVEINQDLCEAIKNVDPGAEVIRADFLTWEHDSNFDKIIMNPPFENGIDIKHIKHAFTMLKPGGRLIALCANGPRQQAAFKADADTWEDLPQGSFSAQGTGVNVALMVLEKEAEPVEGEQILLFA